MCLIDHFVLVAGNLPDARQHYQQIGFNVAPDGIHPFGTYNANMYFRKGPMIETLSIENHIKYVEAIEAGNTFVKNDALFRAEHGDEGFSHIAMTSTDAELDHRSFQEHGISGGNIVSFSRQFEQPDGQMETVAVKLAFATHPKAQCGFYFTCQDIAVPEIDRSTLLKHENGALGVNHAISCSNEPLLYVDLLKELSRSSEIHANKQKVKCLFPNGSLSIITPEKLKQEFGISLSTHGTSLQHKGLIFTVADIKKTELFFIQNKIVFKRHNERLITQSNPESAEFFAFEQNR
ncbi:VOC family protein [Aliamphritea ceti]|uniref:VOC family protein n=1 Tax=Aliamphritea ceti TaxID=1524258 RepID=UPI0021C3F4DA|nr:VOC family protein [Aliamphritea ceti]